MRKWREFLVASLILMGAVLFNGGDGCADQSLKIGVIHLMATHPDHIVLRQSFVDALREKGYAVEVSVFDANSAAYPDTYVQRAVEEARRMEAAGIQLIFCTAIYHALVSADLKIPVIDSVMLSPQLLNLAINDNGALFCRGNATGTIFGYSFKNIVAFIKDSMPGAQKIAYLYNPASPVSRPPRELQEESLLQGFEVLECPFQTREEMMTVLEKASETTDVAFGTNDMAVLKAEQLALDLAASKNFPIIAGVVPLVQNGALAGIQWNWDRAGRMCAEKAIKILQGVAANTIPLEYPDQVEIGLNMQVAERLEIEIPYAWIELATQIVQE